MRTNAELQKSVIDELRWEPSITEKEVGVAAKDGVVTLSGAVHSYAEKWAAERAAERVSGVRAVANELEVRLPGAQVRSDTELAHKVVDAMAWDIQVPDDKVHVTIVNGWVTIEGEVEWQYQKDAAIRAVRNLTGVRGVTNDIRVVPKHVSEFDVSGKIKDALRRRAERDADKIVVQAQNNVVTLRGTVSSFAERRAAEGAAWSAPGVKEVHDELIVGI